MWRISSYSSCRQIRKLSSSIHQTFIHHPSLLACQENCAVAPFRRSTTMHRKRYRRRQCITLASLVLPPVGTTGQYILDRPPHKLGPRISHKMSEGTTWPPPCCDFSIADDPAKPRNGFQGAKRVPLYSSTVSPAAIPSLPLRATTSEPAWRITRLVSG